MKRKIFYHIKEHIFLCFLATIIMVLYVGQVNGQPDIEDSSQEFEVLISNNIRSVAADDDNIWIATNRGVSRFSKADSDWTSYTKEDGLVSDNVYFVASDGQEVWFGTDSGLSRLTLGTGHWMTDAAEESGGQPASIRNPASGIEKWTTYREKDGLISDRINCITQDEKYVWIGTNKGLARYDRNIDSWSARTQEDGLTTDMITSIAVDKESVWLGTKAERKPRVRDRDWRRIIRTSGLNKYDRNTDSWNSYTPEEGLISGQVCTIDNDEDMVWIGTLEGGISCYSKKDQAFVKSYSKSEILDTNNIKFVLVDSIYTWIGTANSGVYRYIKTTDTWMHYTVEDGLASNHITSIAVLGDEVWFGTYEDGLSKYNKLSQEWNTYVKASYPADNDVRWISVNGEEVWAATAKGLSRYDMEMGQWKTYSVKDGLTSDYITHVEAYGDYVFLPVEGSLCGLNRKTEKLKFYDLDAGYGMPDDGTEDQALNITTLKIIGTGGTIPLVFIGTTRSGVFSLLLQGESMPSSLLTPDQLPDRGVLSIEVTGELELGTGELWIGTHEGLIRYNLEDQSRKLYTQEDGLASNHVNILLRSGNKLWIGTTGGLSRYDLASETFMTFTSEDGLPCDNVRALALADNGGLWIGTPGGLALLLGVSVQHPEYEIRTALLDESENSFRNNIRSIGIKGDTLWLATAAGILEFNEPIDRWKQHRAETRRTPFIEPGVNNIEFSGKDVWLSNWVSSPSGCIARFDRVCKSWLRYTTRDILNVKQVAETSTITNVRKIIPEERYVWFATDWGVLRYDNELDTWRHYTTADGLVDNNSRYMVTGGDTVWVSSSGRMINKYNEKTDRWLTMRFQSLGQMQQSPIEWDREWRLEDIERSEESERRYSVSDIMVAGGSIWFKIGSGIMFFNEYTKELRGFTTEDGLVSDMVQCIGYDGQHIWVGHGPNRWTGLKGGISRYNIATGEWTGYFDTSILADERIGRILVSEELVWFLPDGFSRNGVTGYNIKQDNWFTLKPEYISEGEEEDSSSSFRDGIIEVLGNGESVWIGTMKSGLLQFHKASDSWRLLTDRDNILNNIVMKDGLEVDNDFVWVGTVGGLRVYDKDSETWTTYTKPTSLMGNEVRTVATDERFVWCGTNKGISRYDKREGTWMYFSAKDGTIKVRVGDDTWNLYQRGPSEGLIDNSITGLAVDDRFLWVTTYQGANRYDKVANIWDRYSQENNLPTSVLGSVITDNSDVWVSTSKGLCRYPRMSDDPNAWATYTSTIEVQPMVFSQEYASSLVSNKVRAISAEEEYIWVGTDRGVSRYNKGKDIWQTLTQEDGLVDDTVNYIAIDGDDVWFGTDKGVSKFSRRSQDWITYTTENALPSGQVTCIALDDNFVWFGTFDAGLVRFDKRSESWRQFTERDGLAHNGVLSIAMDGDFMWVGTRRGLSRHDKRTNTWTAYREY